MPAYLCGNRKFIVTFHASERYAERFPEIQASIYTAIAKSREATFQEWTDLEVQSMEHTKECRRNQKTVYMIWNKVAFICRKEIGGTLVVLTCWRIMDVPQEDPKVIEDLVNFMGRAPLTHISFPAKAAQSRLVNTVGHIQYKLFVDRLVKVSPEIGPKKFIQRWNDAFPAKKIQRESTVCVAIPAKPKSENPLTYLEWVSDKDFSVEELRQIIGEQAGYHRLKALIKEVEHRTIDRQEFLSIWEDRKNKVLTKREVPVMIGSISLKDLTEKEQSSMKRPKKLKMKVWFSAQIVDCYVESRSDEERNVPPYCGWIKDVANDKLIRGKVYQSEDLKLYFLPNNS